MSQPSLSGTDLGGLDDIITFEDYIDDENRYFTSRIFTKRIVDSPVKDFHIESDLEKEEMEQDLFMY